MRRTEMLGKYFSRHKGVAETTRLVKTPEKCFRALEADEIRAEINFCFYRIDHHIQFCVFSKLDSRVLRATIGTALQLRQTEQNWRGKNNNLPTLSGQIYVSTNSGTAWTL